MTQTLYAHRNIIKKETKRHIYSNCLKLVGKGLMTSVVIPIQGFGVSPPQLSFIKTNCYLKIVKSLLIKMKGVSAAWTTV
jgi:hypothetical protein